MSVVAVRDLRCAACGNVVAHVVASRVGTDSMAVVARVEAASSMEMVSRVAKVKVIDTRHTVAVSQVLRRVRSTRATNARSATRQVVCDGTRAIGLARRCSEDEAVLEVRQCHRGQYGRRAWRSSGSLVLDRATVSHL